MKIGIISDTHDNLPKIAEAVAILNRESLDLVVHCGDYVAPFSLVPFKKLNCDWVGIFGNNDGERKGLAEKSKGRINEAPYFFNRQGKRIALTHEFSDLGADIVAFGHSHHPEVTKKSGRLLINPGEASGWLSGKSSLVILDLDNMDAQIIYF